MVLRPPPSTRGIPATRLGVGAQPAREETQVCGPVTRRGRATALLITLHPAHPSPPTSAGHQTTKTRCSVVYRMAPGRHAGQTSKTSRLNRRRAARLAAAPITAPEHRPVRLPPARPLFPSPLSYELPTEYQEWVGIETPPAASPPPGPVTPPPAFPPPRLTTPPPAYSTSHVVPLYVHEEDPRLEKLQRRGVDCRPHGNLLSVLNQCWALLYNEAPTVRPAAED